MTLRSLMLVPMVRFSDSVGQPTHESLSTTLMVSSRRIQIYAGLNR
jgi:hypothetical protein